MSRVRPLEVRALVPLLEQDWETPEALAEALIRTLDESRASRTSYVAVMQFGSPAAWYSAIGPYPGRKSAEKAVTGDPGASLASKVAVVPLTSAEGLQARIEKYDAPPEKKSA